MSLGRKAQTISFDAVIAVVLFSAASILLFFVLDKNTTVTQFKSVEQDAEKLTDVVSSPQNFSISIVSGSKVDEDRLAELAERAYAGPGDYDYTYLKSQYGISSDFCIHFEDEKGNVVPASDQTIGIGSPEVKIGGVPCNEPPP